MRSSFPNLLHIRHRRAFRIQPNDGEDLRVRSAERRAARCGGGTPRSRPDALALRCRWSGGLDIRMDGDDGVQSFAYSRLHAPSTESGTRKNPAIFYRRCFTAKKRTGRSFCDTDSMGGSW